MGIISAVNRWPLFSVSMTEVLFNSPIPNLRFGSAVSQRIQININGPEAEYVADANSGRNAVIDVQASDGYKIVGGYWDIDKNDHFSANGDPPGTILALVVPIFFIDKYDPKKSVFVMKAAEPPYNLHNLHQGVINAAMIVNFMTA